MPSDLYADVLFLTDGTLLGGQILSQSTTQVTMNVKELRSPKAAYNAPGFLFAKDRGEFKPQELAGNLVYASEKPLLLENAAIPLRLVRQQLKTESFLLTLKVASEVVIEKDFYQKTSDAILYYDLSKPDEGAITEAEEALRPGLKKALLKDVKLAERADPDAAERRIYPPPMFTTGIWQILSDPRVGGAFSFYEPVGAVGDMNFSPLGLYLYGSVNLPLETWIPALPLSRWNLRTRGGFYFGYHYLTAETEYANSSINLFPIMVQAALYYDFPQPWQGFYFSPSFKWSNGMIISTVEKNLKPAYVSQLSSGKPTVTGSYIGYATQLTLGLEVKHKSSERISYFMDFGYLAHVEDLTGTFVTIEFGAAWHLAPRIGMATLPPAETRPGLTTIPLNLTGNLSNALGKPISGTIEVMELKSQKVTQKVSAGVDGKYSLVLAPGYRYKITATKAAHSTASAQFDLVDNIEESAKRDFSLAEKSFKLENVNFAPGKDVLLTQSFPALNSLVEFLQKNEDIRIAIEGHTDSLGNAAQNTALSLKRADAVKKYLVSKGIAADRLETVGYGPEKPVADNATRQGQALNRRVEARIITE